MKMITRLVPLFWIVLAGCNAPFRAVPLPTALPEPANTPAPETTPLPDSDACSVAGQQRQIDEAFEAYQLERVGETSALLGLSEWAGVVSAEISTRCIQSPTPVTDDETLRQLLDKLQAGGHILYVRHTHTDRTRGDTDVSLGACEQQRILSERGREEALFMRAAYQQLNLPVDQLISTQYCRTLETAILAFGVPQVISRSELTNTLTDRLAEKPAVGHNTIIVAHIGTIRNAIGLDDTFEEGDTLVYRPLDDGNQFEFVGRIGLYDWPALARLSQQ